MSNEEHRIVEVKTLKMKMSPSELKREVTLLDDCYKNLMQKGTDFGTIPNTPKPTLLKAGAEILLRAFHLELTTEEISSKIIDDVDNPYFDFTIRITLFTTREDGTLVRVGDGVGSANTRETRYTFRWMFENDLPRNFDRQNAVTRTIRSRDGRRSFTQYRRNSAPDEVYTLKNTVLKMAKKRAFVDAILTCTGADRIFTQDIEDLPKDLTDSEPEEPTHDSQPEKPSSPSVPFTEYTPIPQKQPEAPKPISVEKVMVRMLKSIPKLTSVDEKTGEIIEIGPFEAESIATIQKSTADIWVKTGVAQLVDQTGLVGEIKLEDTEGGITNNYGTAKLDGENGEIVPSSPVSPAEKPIGWLVRQLQAIQEKNPEFLYSFEEDGGNIGKIVLMKIDRASFNKLVKDSKWALKTVYKKSTEK
ncbi:MAG: hypothetical protein ABID61_02340 [Candidatus Micrarchaeota archaeon]